MNSTGNTGPCPSSFWRSLRRESMTSMRNLCQCSITLTVKNYWLLLSKGNFLYSSECLLPLVLFVTVYHWKEPASIFTASSGICTHWWESALTSSLNRSFGDMALLSACHYMGTRWAKETLCFSAANHCLKKESVFSSFYRKHLYFLSVASKYVFIETRKTLE